MQGHFATLVAGQSFSQRSGHLAQPAGEAVEDVGGAQAVQAHEHDETAGALHESADGGAATGALDEIALSMIRDDTGGDLGRPQGDGRDALELGGRVERDLGLRPPRERARACGEPYPRCNERTRNTADQNGRRSR